MSYTKKQKEDIFKDILKDITKGDSLTKALAVKGRPAVSTFYIWLKEDSLKSKEYARAALIRADKLFDEILDIADSPNAEVSRDEYGKLVINGEITQRSRIRIDARKWYLSKLNPKKYSDKMQIDTTEFKEQPLFDVDEAVDNSAE